MAAKKPMAIKSRLSDRSTNRNSKTRKALSWALPASGSLDAWLDKRLVELGDDGKRLQYSPAALLWDISEMLEAETEDLAAFRAQDIGVTRRHFELLRVLQRRLVETGADKRVVGTSTEAVNEDIRIAMLGVHKARGALAYRWAANGLPLQDIDLRRSSGSPRALHAAGREVVLAAHAHLEAGSFDSPAYVKKLMGALEKALDELANVAGLRVKVRVDRGAVQKQRRLLVRCAYEYALWLSRWGRAMAGDDPEAQRRWRLDKTFPNQDKLARATSDEQLVKVATRDPVEEPA